VLKRGLLEETIGLLVDGDSPENVELKPGDAGREEHRIQLFSSMENPLGVSGQSVHLQSEIPRTYQASTLHGSR